MVDETPESGPLVERARSIREWNAMQLSSRVQHMDQRGNQWDGPRIAHEFDLVAVKVSGTVASPEVDVLFKWNGEQGTFGMMFPIRKDDPAIIGAEDGHISAQVEQNLTAPGKGIENAHRRVENGVAWLSWEGSESEDLHPSL